MNAPHDHPAHGSDLDRLASVNLNLLVPMLALLEEGSVTRAAARVGMSQPAMSHALGRMRRLVGDDLVERQGSGLVLTPRAVALIAPLRDLLRQTARLVDSPDFDPRQDNRIITVAMTSSTAFVIGARLARLITERAPNATLRIRNLVAPRPQDFIDGEIDAILVSEAFDSPYPRQRLYENRWVVIAHPDSDPDASALDLLTSLPHVAYDDPQRVPPYSVMDDQGVDYRIGQFVSDHLLIPHLVSEFRSVAVHTFRVASSMAEQMDLRIEEFPFPVPALGIDVVWNPRQTNEKYAAWLSEILVEVATFGATEIIAPEQK